MLALRLITFARRRPEQAQHLATSDERKAEIADILKIGRLTPHVSALTSHGHALCSTKAHFCNGFRTPAQARTAARAPRPGVRNRPVNEGAGLGHPCQRALWGIGRHCRCSRRHARAIGASMGSPDVVRPAGFDPIRAAFVAISRVRRRCQAERGPSGIDAGR